MADPTNKPTLGAGCLSLFGVPFALAGVGLCWLAIDSISLHARSTTWTKVQATIEKAELEVHSGDKSDSYSVDAEYSYTWNNKIHHATRVGVEHGSSSDSIHAERAAELKAAMEAGRTVPAWVDPRAPDEALLYRDLRGMVYALLAAGLLFGGVGFALIVGGLVGGRRERWKRQRVEAFPGRPWRHERNWNGFTISSETGRNLTAGWGAVTFLGLFLGPFIALIGFGDGGVGGKVVVFGLLVIWVVLFGFTIKATAARMVRGSAKLVVDTLPIRPGASVRGVVVVGSLIQGGVAKAKLRCLESDTFRDRNRERTTTTRELFSEEFTVDSAQWSREADRTSIPVTLAPPADGAPRSDGNPAIEWVLEIKISTGGIDAAYAFELPVFSVDETLLERAP